MKSKNKQSFRVNQKKNNDTIRKIGRYREYYWRVIGTEEDNGRKFYSAPFRWSGALLEWSKKFLRDYKCCFVLKDFTLQLWDEEIEKWVDMDSIPRYSPVKIEKITRGDYIRKLSDEALANWLCEFLPEGCSCNECPGDKYCTPEHSGLIDWLKEEI